MMADATEKEWEAEHDLRTLIAAERIKADPKRMKMIKAKRDEMLKALANVGDTGNGG